MAASDKEANAREQKHVVVIQMPLDRPPIGNTVEEVTASIPVEVDWLRHGCDSSVEKRMESHPT